MNKGALVRLVCTETGIESNSIGRIDILGGFSFFEVDSAYQEKLLKTFNSQSFKSRKINLEVSTKEPPKRNKSSRSRRRSSGSGSRTKTDRRSSRGSKNSSSRSDRKRRKKQHIIYLYSLVSCSSVYCRKAKNEAKGTKTYIPYSRYGIKLYFRLTD